MLKKWQIDLLESLPGWQEFMNDKNYAGSNLTKGERMTLAEKYAPHYYTTELPTGDVTIVSKKGTVPRQAIKGNISVVLPGDPLPKAATVFADDSVLVFWVKVDGMTLYTIKDYHDSPVTDQIEAQLKTATKTLNIVKDRRTK